VSIWSLCFARDCAPDARREAHIHIHYIHDGPIPSLAANAVQVAKMCAAFQANGTSVTLTVPAGRVATDDELKAEYRLTSDLTVRRLRSVPMPGSKLIFGALAVVGQWSSDSIVFTRSVSVSRMSTLLGVPTILELHGPISMLRDVMPGRLRRVASRPSFRLVVVISERLKQDYEAGFPELRDRILVAPDGADPVNGHPADAVPLAGSFRVGYLGHLYPGKGMELIEQLAPIRPRMTFHIVGGRPADVSRWRERTRAVPNIVYHGHVPHAETRRYLASMDVVLAPYQRVVVGSGGGANLADWMSPLKIFEYMAEGKAILSSDLPVLREVLVDRSNALLRGPEDVAGWADGLSALETDARLRARIGAQGRNDLLERYTWNQRARAILAAVSGDSSQAGLRRCS
jgi:glycosyltransferase involved in cell wall biosynthesis